MSKQANNLVRISMAAKTELLRRKAEGHGTVAEQVDALLFGLRQQIPQVGVTATEQRQ